MIWVWGYLIGAAVALVVAIWASDDPRDAVPCVVAAAVWPLFLLITLGISLRWFR